MTGVALWLGPRRRRSLVEDSPESTRSPWSRGSRSVNCAASDSRASDVDGLGIFRLGLSSGAIPLGLLIHANDLLLAFSLRPGSPGPHRPPPCLDKSLPRLLRLRAWIGSIRRRLPRCSHSLELLCLSDGAHSSMTRIALMPTCWWRFDCPPLLFTNSRTCMQRPTPRQLVLPGTPHGPRGNSQAGRGESSTAERLISKVPKPGPSAVAGCGPFRFQQHGAANPPVSPVSPVWQPMVGRGCAEAIIYRYPSCDSPCMSRAGLGAVGAKQTSQD